MMVLVDRPVHDGGWWRSASSLSLIWVCHGLSTNGVPKMVVSLLIPVIIGWVGTTIDGQTHIKGLHYLDGRYHNDNGTIFGWYPTSQTLKVPSKCIPHSPPWGLHYFPGGHEFMQDNCGYRLTDGGNHCRCPPELPLLIAKGARLNRGVSHEEKRAPVVDDCWSFAAEFCSVFIAAVMTMSQNYQLCVWVSVTNGNQLTVFPTDKK